MKNATLALIILFATIINSKAQYKSERSFDTFQKVVITDGIKAKIIQSNEHKVVLRVSDMPETKVLTELSAYELSIKLETGIYEKGQVYAEIYLKDLKSLDLRNSVNVEMENMKGDALKLRAITSAKAELNFEYNYTEIDIATNSDITLKGKSNISKVNANTNASLKAYEFEVENYEIKVNTQAEVFVSSIADISIQASTKGRAYYKGDPKHLKEKKSLGGEIVDAD